MPVFTSRRTRLAISSSVEYAGSSSDAFTSISSYIHNIALHLRDGRAISHWTMYDSTAVDFARRLHASARLRERVAGGLGVSLADFDAQAPEALRAAHKLGQFPDDDAIRVLESGSRR